MSVDSRVSRAACTFLFFFFNDTATTEIYTLSLHDALPISSRFPSGRQPGSGRRDDQAVREAGRIWPAPARRNRDRDRKSTRLNSSHQIISYAVFCLKKKKQNPYQTLLGQSTHRHDNTSTPR